MRLVLILVLNFLIFSPSTQNPQEEEKLKCGKIKIPISNRSSMSITCRSGKLYSKTSIDLFHVSSVKSGARVSMEVEGHMPNLCRACQRPDGNYEVALRCLCHPKECKDKVVNSGTNSRASFGITNMQLLLCFSAALFLISF